MAKPRDYRKEYDTHGGTPEQIKRRAGRNKARAMMVKAGRVCKGDGKEVEHINFNTLDNGAKNLKVVPKSVNRKKQPKRTKT